MYKKGMWNVWKQLKNEKIYLNDCYFQYDDSLESLYDLLKEDLLQIGLSHSYVIDVGWYPEFYTLIKTVLKICF